MMAPIGEVAERLKAPVLKTGVSERVPRVRISPSPHLIYRLVYNDSMRFLGIDYGKKRVGIALSDEEGKFALAHTVLPNTALVEAVKKIIFERGVGAVVVGESKDFKGAENPIMTDIKSFAQDLAKEATIPVYFEPEFMTSAEAARIQGETGKLDASAAAIILQSYLDKHAKR